MQEAELKKLISTPSGVLSATKWYVLTCFVGWIIFGNLLWEKADLYFAFSAGDYIYPTMAIIGGVICILTLSVQTKLAKEEYSRIYPLASFGSNINGSLIINLFFVLSSILPIIVLLLPFSYTVLDVREIGGRASRARACAPLGFAASHSLKDTHSIPHPCTTMYTCLHLSSSLRDFIR